VCGGGCRRSGENGTSAWLISSQKEGLWCFGPLKRGRGRTRHWRGALGCTMGRTKWKSKGRHAKASCTEKRGAREMEGGGAQHAAKWKREKGVPATRTSDTAGRDGGPAPATPQVRRRWVAVGVTLSPRQGRSKGVRSGCVGHHWGRPKMNMALFLFIQKNQLIQI
jgi:hypothetical protein